MKAGVGWAVVLWLWAAPVAWAGQYVLQAGQTNTVPVSARVLNGETACNLVIEVPGQAPLERVVQAPFFDAAIVITPPDEEVVTVRWQGRSRRVGEQVVNGCPSQGETRFQVVAHNALTRAVWAGMLAQLPPAKAQCLRVVFEHERVRPEWFDFKDPQRSGEDAKIDRAFERCEAFLAQVKAWGAQNPQGHACTVGGVKTRCEGFYTASVNGKPQTISQEAAMLRQWEQLPWRTGVREIVAVRNSRHQQEKDRVVRQAAEETAKLQAAEEALVQAEKQEQEAKAAEQRALQERIAALRIQVAQEKALAAQERHWLLQQVDKLRGVPAQEAKASDPAAAAEPPAAAPVPPAPAPAPASALPAAAPAAASAPV
jgi:hypothetical protein